MITIKEAEEILKKEYHIDNFKFLVGDILLPDYIEDKHEVAFDNSLFSSVTILGESKACEVAVFEVMVNDGYQNRRVGITQEMFRILRGLHINNALVAFANADKNNYRISLLTSKYEFDGDKIVKILSNPRRYSYSFGFGTKTKTAYKFLIEKGKVSSLDELISRFSVEVVNKQFYTEIATAFTELVGGERNGKKYEKLLDIYSIVDHNKFAEFGVRLIGRIMFCWFLREKRSENGIPLVPDDMLSLDSVTKSNNYYHQVLEPLFFELLNTNQNRRKPEFQTDYYSKVPYLNGGLFSPQTDDHYKYDTVNHCGAYGIVTIPNEWFNRLYAVLNEYNFTVDENTAYDIELSIDPEMLGRIFENLLAEINPETGENAKKSTGSFYTPRDIVDYMVDSSLCEYLKTKTGIDEIKLKALISYSKEDDDLAVFDKSEKKKLIDALYTVTALDPACGSGAFPIGMLQKIVYMLQELDPSADLWFDKATENAPRLLKQEFERKFNSGSLNYIRKLCVIQNSIFGIDIQPIAVEISRLRCFLSLIIEEKVHDDEENRGINPLPNLDFKFIIANSLITLDNDGQLSFFESQEHIDQLKAIREEYFNADSGRRTELKLEFANVQQDMLVNTINNYDKQSSSMYAQLSAWKPFANESTDWFDPEWMFGIKDGFDIVIGNPPYINVQKYGAHNPFIEYIKSHYSEVWMDKSDILFYFIHLGYQLSKSIVCYITSNAYLFSDKAKKLRNLIVTKLPLKEIINFENYQIFESASITCCVNLFCKCDTSSNSIKIRAKSFDDSKLKLNEALNENTPFFDVDLYKDSFFALIPQRISDLDKKIKSKHPLLGTILKVGKGMETAANEVFLFDHLPEFPQSFIKKRVSGEIIKKYYLNDSFEYVLYYESIEAFDKLPTEIQSHLIANKDVLDARATVRNEGRPWWKYSRPMHKEYYDNQKIWCSYRGAHNIFALDATNDCIGFTNTVAIFDTNPNYDIKYILALVNSKLLEYQHKNNAKQTGGGIYEYVPNTIERYPIPSICKEEQQKFVLIIDEILLIKAKDFSADISIQEKALNDKVYELYGLTDEEIALVEESVK